jgi:hypothetical protein
MRRRRTTMRRTGVERDLESPSARGACPASPSSASSSRSSGNRVCNPAATRATVSRLHRDLALYLCTRGPLAQLGERRPCTAYGDDGPPLKTQETKRRRDGPSATRSATHTIAVDLGRMVALVAARSSRPPSWRRCAYKYQSLRLPGPSGVWSGVSGQVHRPVRAGARQQNGQQIDALPTGSYAVCLIVVSSTEGAM